MVKSLDLVFENRICWRVLTFFLDNPSGEFYEKEIQQKVGAAKLSVSKWLRVLGELGFISVNRRGRLKLNRLNRENPLVKQLKILSTVSRLLPKLRPLSGMGEMYLYGSAARGEDVEGSDIDILLIGRDRRLVGKLKAIDKRVKANFLTPLEWAKAARDDPAFYERVERDKIRLV